MIAKTINIHLVCEIASYITDSQYLYSKPRVEDGIVKITPVSSDDYFQDVYLVPKFLDVDFIEDNTNTKSINLTANVELEVDAEPDFLVSVNDLGEIEIRLDSVGDCDKFVDVVEEIDSQMIVEDESDKDDEEKSEIDTASIEAKVLVESADTQNSLEEKLYEMTNKWTLESGDLETDFEDEYNEALSILPVHYEYVEAAGNSDGTYRIRFNDPKLDQLTEAMDPIYPFDIDAAEELVDFMKNPQPKNIAMNRLEAIFMTDDLKRSINSLDTDADVRPLVKDALAEIIESHDKDRSDFKIPVEQKVKDILDSILAADINANLEEDLGDEDEGPAWVVVYDLDNGELTEDIESESNSEVIYAPDIETAVKYAEQNARIKARENPDWKSAEVVSIQRK